MGLEQHNVRILPAFRAEKEEMVDCIREEDISSEHKLLPQTTVKASFGERNSLSL